MLINIGSKLIRSGDIRSINIQEKTILDYQGNTHQVDADIDVITKQINDEEKSGYGMARLSSTVQPDE